MHCQWSEARIALGVGFEYLKVVQAGAGETGNQEHGSKSDRYLIESFSVLIVLSNDQQVFVKEEIFKSDMSDGCKWF
jgi:hypothetical protein